MKAMYEWFSINVIVVKDAQCQIILFLGVLHKHVHSVKVIDS